MSGKNGLREQLIDTIGELPEDSLPELAEFLEFLRFKRERVDSGRRPMVEPVVLEGLWKGVRLDEADIDDIRREMWSGFGDRQL